tara:strand:+ start:1212 stop:2099 length:888 start_codon:yes stop_codon:yes gene_type:complete
MNLHIFGASSLIGETFIDLMNMEAPEFQKVLYSRNKINFINFDIKNLQEFKNYNFGNNSVIVSFCPIWVLIEFLKYLDNNNKKFAKQIKSIIACSSSSSLTKKYAFSNFDRQLATKLELSENLLLDMSRKNNISCVVLQPTLIYGISKSYTDQNIYKIIHLMRKFPLIIVPDEGGMRQPIHALELSKVVLFFLRKTLNRKNKTLKKLPLGGDEELSYKELLKRIKINLPVNDKAKKCLILSLPQKIFIIIIFPVAFISAKTFEALLRISSNLSGFNKVKKILKIRPNKFPAHKFY